MKILITIYDGAIAKNLLRSDVLKTLVAVPGMEVVVLTRADKLDYYRKEFPYPNVRFVASGHQKVNVFELVVSTVALNSIPTQAMRIWQRSRYLGKGKRLFHSLASVLRHLGRFRAWRGLLRWIDRYLVPTDRFYSDLLDRERPDLVFLSTMISLDDVSLSRLAIRRGIRIAGMVKSWDNPTTKSFIRQIPDKVIVHNVALRDEVIRLYDVPPERVEVVGIPQYDRWGDESLVMSRDELFRSLGADPGKRLILYAAAGDWMNQADAEIVTMLSSWVADGRLGAAQILVRLHPKYPSTAEKLRGLPGVIVDRPGTAPTGDITGWEYETKDVRHLISCLRWSDVTINTASTFTIDAAIIDRPIVLVGFDGSRKLPYDSSVVRYYDREHMRGVLDTGGARLARSEDELLSSVKAYLDDPTADVAGRARIRESQCYRLDGRAGERIARCLIGLMKARE